MGQSTLDDEELFGEAAAEIREDVEDELAAARDALPTADGVWDVEADNVLGVLNGLRSALDADAVTEHLRAAKKWYTMGERADAFEDADDLAAEIDRIEGALDDLADASDAVGELAATLPEIRATLDDLHAGADDGEGEEDEGEAEAAEAGDD